MKFLKGTRGGRARVLALPLVALVAALALAACGGSSSGSSSGSTGKSASASAGTTTGSGGGSTGGSTTTTSSGSGSSKFAAQRAKLQQCLKKHGVTLPNRPAGGYGSGHYGGGAPGGGTPGTGTTHTFTRPPGGFRGGGAGGPGGGGFAGGNSKFAKAFKACGANFGSGGFAGRGGFRGGAGGGSGQTPHISSTVLKQFVSCIRKNGYPQMPEASTSKNTNGGLFPKSIESNPKFQKASKSCESVLQSAFRRPPGGTGTTSTGTSTSSSA